MYFVTKRMEFDAGHRLHGYQGPCARLHGHRYVLEVTVQGTELDKLGMLMDFGILKAIVDRYVQQWDHREILHPEDELASLPDVALMKEGNPTAENMAREIYKHIDGDLAFESASLSHVRLYETPDCWVDYFED